MKVGMLWFDGDRSAAVRERIERAVSYYRQKYGALPNICVSHPTTLGSDRTKRVAGVRIEKSRCVLPDHFWVGIEEANN